MLARSQGDSVDVSIIQPALEDIHRCAAAIRREIAQNSELGAALAQYRAPRRPWA